MAHGFQSPRLRRAAAHVFLACFALTVFFALMARYKGDRVNLASLSGFGFLICLCPLAWQELRKPRT
jgi:hypothetical protein